MSPGQLVRLKQVPHIVGKVVRTFATGGLHVQFDHGVSWSHLREVDTFEFEE